MSMVTFVENRADPFAGPVAREVENRGTWLGGLAGHKLGIGVRRK
jgi:hypothetical protein